MVPEPIQRGLDHVRPLQASIQLPDSTLIVQHSSMPCPAQQQGASTSNRQAREGANLAEGHRMQKLDSRPSVGVWAASLAHAPGRCAAQSGLALHNQRADVSWLWNVADMGGFLAASAAEKQVVAWSKVTSLSSADCCHPHRGVPAWASTLRRVE